jgi:hypothetical protein
LAPSGVVHRGPTTYKEAIVPSFYVTDTKLTILSEFSSLKDAEKALRVGTVPPGDYLVVQVVREASITPVPETTRVQLIATRTRARTAGATPRPRKRKGAGASEAPNL